MPDLMTPETFGTIFGGLGSAYAVIRVWALIRRLVWGSL